jgi:hypothetical protein
MRRWILVLLTASLALASVQSIATAAVKPGTKCTKQGQTSTSAGIKYTCIKSGNKLVWNKGVAVKKAAPVATPKSSEPPKTSDPFSVYGIDAERFRAVD